MQSSAYLEMRENEDHHWWFVARRTILKKILNTLSEGVKFGSVLEIGCGTGGNLELLMEYGRLSAMELDDNARSLANQRGFCGVVKGSLPTEIPFNEAFDLVLMLDVLEHVVEDSESLRNVAARLKVGGKLLVTVPAYQFLWSAHDVALEHKRRYLKGQVERLIQDSGLTVRYSTYFNTLMLPAVFLARLMTRLFGKKVGTDVGRLPAFMNDFLKKIFSSERYFLPTISFPAGVSILVVAERSL